MTREAAGFKQVSTQLQIASISRGSGIMTDMRIEVAPNGEIIIYARETGGIHVATLDGRPVEIRAWEELYAPDIWRRCGSSAGSAMFVVRDRADVERIVSGFMWPDADPVDVESHSNEVERLAAGFGLAFGDNWEPVVG